MPDTKIFKYFEKNNDYNGMIDYMITQSVKFGIIESDPTHTSLDADKVKDELLAFQEYIRELSTMPVSDEHKQVLDRICSTYVERNTRTVVAVEKKSREVTEKILNGEIPELSHLRGNKKESAKYARHLVAEQETAGIELSALDAFSENIFTAVTSHGCDSSYLNRIRTDRDNSVHQAFQTEFPDIALEKRNDKEYWADLSRGSGRPDGEIKVSSIVVFDSRKLMAQTDPFCTQIYNCSDEELDAVARATEQKRSLLNEGKEKLLTLRDDSKQLKEALLSIEGIDLENESVKEVTEELDNLQKFGTPTFMLAGPNGKRQPIEKVNAVAYQYAIKGLEKCADTLDKAYGDGAGAAGANAGKQAVGMIRDFLKAKKGFLAEVKKDHFKYDENDVDREIGLIGNERLLRAESNDKTRQLESEIGQRDQEVRYMANFAESAQRGINALKGISAFLNNDKKGRTKPSESYKYLVRQLDKLTKMRAEDVTPTQLIGQMEFTLSAAKSYSKAHTGWRHPFSAQKDAGIARLESAQLVEKVIEDKLAELRPLFNSLNGKRINGMVAQETKPSDCRRMNEEKNAAARTELAQERIAHTFEKQKEDFKDLAAEACLKAKYDASLEEHFSQHPEYTEEQREQVRRSTISLEDYVRDEKPALMRNSCFNQFMSDIKDAETLEQMRTMASTDPSGFYNRVNAAAGMSRQDARQQEMKAEAEEKRPTYDDKIREIQKKLKDNIEQKRRYPDKSGAKLDYATIVAATILKVGQKKQDGSGAVGVDDKALHDLSVEIASSNKAFGAVVKKFDDKQMYEKAVTDKGTGLFTTYLRADAQFREYEQIKKNEQNKKNEQIKNNALRTKEAKIQSLDRRLKPN